MNKTIILTSIWVLMNGVAVADPHGERGGELAPETTGTTTKKKKGASVNQTPGYNEKAVKGQVTTTGQKTTTVDTPEGGATEVNKVNAVQKKITNTSKLMKKSLELGPKTTVTGPDQQGMYTVTVGGIAYQAKKVPGDRAKRLSDRARLLSSEVSYAEQSGGAIDGTEAFEVVGTPPKLSTLLNSDGKKHQASYYAFITERSRTEGTAADIGVLLVREGRLVGGGGGGGGGGGEPGQGAEGEAPPAAPGN